MICTTSLSLSIELKEMGVAQDSSMAFFGDIRGNTEKFARVDRNTDYCVDEDGLLFWIKKHPDMKKIDIERLVVYRGKWAAYTFAELLTMMPHSIEKDGFSYINIFYKCMPRNDDPKQMTRYCMDYTTIDRRRELFGFVNQNPAEAAGLLLKWCIENEHVNLNKGEKL